MVHTNTDLNLFETHFTRKIKKMMRMVIVNEDEISSWDRSKFRFLKKEQIEGPRDLISTRPLYSIL